MEKVYTRGELVRIKGTLVDSDGVALDPDVVSAKVKSPSGTITSYTYPSTLSKEGVGIYYTDINVNESGRWYYRFESTGNGQAAEDSTFFVPLDEFSE